MSDFSVDELRRLSEAATLRRVAPRFGRPAGSASAKLAAASGLARNDHVWMSTHCSERCAGNRRSQHESAATTPPLPRRDGAAVSAREVRAGERVIRDERYTGPTGTATRRVLDGRLRVRMTYPDGRELWMACRACEGCDACAQMVDHECVRSIDATKAVTP